MRFTAMLCAIAIAISIPCATHAQTPQRRIAVTFDDLPGTNAATLSADEVLALNTKLVSTLKAENIPIIGFVNESQLYFTGQVDERIHSLDLWPAAGFDLGNHTFSHVSLNHVPLDDWETNVLRGETVTRILLDQHHKTLKYFRYPYLDMGADLTTRRQAETFLAEHNYRIAPVTFDEWDWYFAQVYADARSRHDTAEEQRVVQSWLAHSAAIFDFYEKKARAVLGHEPSEVLLAHDTWLEAEHFQDLAALLRKRGYKFISLDEALEDQGLRPTRHLRLRRGLDLHRPLGHRARNARPARRQTKDRPVGAGQIQRHRRRQKTTVAISTQRCATNPGAPSMTRHHRGMGGTFERSSNRLQIPAAESSFRALSLWL